MKFDIIVRVPTEQEQISHQDLPIKSWAPPVKNKTAPRLMPIVAPILLTLEEGWRKPFACSTIERVNSKGVPLSFL